VSTEEIAEVWGEAKHWARDNAPRFAGLPGTTVESEGRVQKAEGSREDHVCSGERETASGERVAVRQSPRGSAFWFLLSGFPYGVNRKFTVTV
jgi:hypothetical protein